MPIGKVWIYRLLFVCFFSVILCVCVCVCTVKDFSAEDKASGVNFCTVVHRHPGHGITYLGELCSPRSDPEAQNQTNRPACEPRERARALTSWPALACRPCVLWPVRRPICPARWPRVELACVQYGRPRRRTYLLVILLLPAGLPTGQPLVFSLPRGRIFSLRPAGATRCINQDEIWHGKIDHWQAVSRQVLRRSLLRWATGPYKLYF